MTDHANFIGGEWTRGADAGPNINPSNIDDVIGQYAKADKHQVEAAIAGRPLNEETATMAGELAITGALALRHNGYKIPLMRNLVRRAVRGGPLPATT